MKTESSIATNSSLPPMASFSPSISWKTDHVKCHAFPSVKASPHLYGLKGSWKDPSRFSSCNLIRYELLYLNTNSFYSIVMDRIEWIFCHIRNLIVPKISANVVLSNI